MINSNHLNRIILFFLVTLVFFGYLITNLYYLQLIVVGLVILGSVSKKRISINDNILWIVLVYLMLFSLIYSEYKIDSIEFMVMFFGALIIKIYFENENNWHETFVKYTLIASSVHVLATLMQFIFPELILRINLLILKGSNLTSNTELYAIGSHAGITGQTGINSFYISLFIGILLCTLLTFNKYNKILLFVMIVLGVLALFLTVKRSQIIVNSVSIASVLWLFSGQNKKDKIINILIPFTLFLVAYFVMKIPGANALSEKINVFANSEDVTNGRREIWGASLDLFYDNPILGVGINTIKYYVSDLSHNIYIQILSEIGILGFVAFILIIISSLTSTIIISKRNNLAPKSKLYLSLSVYFQVYFIIYGFFGNPLYGMVFLLIYVTSIALGRSLQHSN